MIELENALKETFEDYRLSKEEKYSFKELLLKHKDDSTTVSFVRNKAFDITNRHIRNQDSFDPVAFKWLEQIVKTIDSVRTAESFEVKNEVYFSPGNNCKNRIISLINSARKSVDICVFTISDDDITSAIITAHKRKVRVRIITDNDKANDLGSDVDYMTERGLALVKDRSPNHMHHKFAIIDSAFLINGSFNWTRSASKYNNENITVLNDPSLIVKFSQKFNELWKEFGGK